MPVVFDDYAPFPGVLLGEPSFEVVSPASVGVMVGGTVQRLVQVDVGPDPAAARARFERLMETLRYGRNWIENDRPGGRGQLPAYIQNVRNAIIRDGTPEGRATAIAIGRVRRWASGAGRVGPEVRAAAAKAIAEWDAMRARARGKKRPVRESGVMDPKVTAMSAEQRARQQQLLEAGRVLAVDVSLLEAASRAPLSNARRRTGESLTSWGRRLKRGDAANARAARASRAPRSGDFESKHPRGPGGRWIVKAGSSGDDVRRIQRKVGATADGAFGSRTRSAVEEFQRKHGLQVDGVVGRQTAAAMRGRRDAARVAPGRLSGSDQRWLRNGGWSRSRGGRTRRRTPRGRSTGGGVLVS